jgi:microcystin-dependent protein
MDYTISPNMNLIIPIVGVEPGPIYASDINNSLTIIDSHNHTNGNGVLITPAAININANLTMAGNSLTNILSLQMTPQTTAPTSSDTIYTASDGNLYYIDGSSNTVKITSGGAVNATSSGISSGTATAQFVSGTLVVDSNTNTPADIQAGSIALGNTVSGSNFLTLSPPNSLSSNYTITLPQIPAAQSALEIDTSGNITTVSIFVPTGALLPFAGATAPSGFLICDGSAYSRTTYSALFAVIGTSYGSGNGSTTFNIPNMAGNVIIGPGGAIGAAVAGSGGEATHTLSIGEMPVHNHGINDPGHNHSPIYSGSVGGNVISGSFGVQGGSTYNVAPITGGLLSPTTVTNNAYTGISTQNTGGGAAHNNVQPYLCLNYIIRT